MSWPGVIPSGQFIHEIGCHIDLLPTICKAAGATVPADRTIDGFDLLPVATSKAKSKHSAIYWSSAGQLAVRREQWKLVENGKDYDGTEQGNQPLQGDDSLFLSNLEDDPGERKNRRHDQPALTDELSSMAHRWLDGVKGN